MQTRTLDQEPHRSVTTSNQSAGKIENVRTPAQGSMCTDSARLSLNTLRLHRSDLPCEPQVNGSSFAGLDGRDSGCPVPAKSAGVRPRLRVILRASELPCEWVARRIAVATLAWCVAGRRRPVDRAKPTREKSNDLSLLSA